MKRHITILALAIVALVAIGRPAWSQGPMQGYGPPPGFGPPGAPPGYGPPPPGYGPPGAPPGYGPQGVPSGFGYAPPMGFDGRPVGYAGPGPEGMPPPEGPGGQLKPIPSEGPGPDGYMDGGHGGSGILDFGCAHKSVWGWFEGEALWWYAQGKHIPPLVTTSPAGTPQTDAGVLGLPTTTVLLGNEQIATGPSSGYRFTLGAWLDSAQEQAIVARYWSLKGVNTFDEFTSDASGSPILARPYLNVGNDPNTQDALLVGYPGITGPGFIQVRSSGNILGGDVLFRSAVDRGCGYRLDFVGGYQGSKINDTLFIRHFLTDQDPGNLIPDGTTLNGFDQFGAVNEFHGGVLGFQGEFQRGPWLFRTLTKLGVGNMHQRVNINGSTTVDTGAGTATTPGGLLAQPTNIGQYSRNEICFVPELNLTLSYQITCHIDINVGYSFIYYSSVAKAAGQIDLGVNTNNPIVDEFRPNLGGIKDSDFYVQGANVGFLVHW